jgi:uncharacterized protein
MTITRSALQGLAAAGILLGTCASAQSNWAQVAVPIYSPAQVLQGLHQHSSLPAAQRFAKDAQALTTALQTGCTSNGADLTSARALWVSASQSWEQLSTVAIGPVLARRSQRQIDFSPTRPALIAKAMQAAPQDAAAMERIGSPAKGLPALEWLLWTQPIAPNTAACKYAVQVAQDVQREALALQSAYEALANTDWPELASDSAGTQLAEWVNQWLGGMERLYWAQMEKPLRASGTLDRPTVRKTAENKTAENKSAKPPALLSDWPRSASGNTVASWSAQWAVLRSMAVFSASGLAQAPQPGQNLVSLESYLRSKGHNPQADALVKAVERADALLRNLSKNRSLDKGQVLQTARAMAAVKTVVAQQVAPVLDITLGFSDADGD